MTEMNEPILVRVAPEVLDKISRDGSEPVVILGIEKQSDGTYDMILRDSPKEQR